MEYRNLGNSGLIVSAVGLGCNNFGGRVDSQRTGEVIAKCIDMGITLFDTADLYGRGKSEEFMAPHFKAHRHDVVIATKSVGPMGEGPYWRGASRKYLMDALDACLTRLDTDYIDLYQMHMVDNRTPVEETLRTLDDMVALRQGALHRRSNYSGWQLTEAMWIAKTEHLEALRQCPEPVQSAGARHRDRARARRIEVRRRHPALLPAGLRLPHRQVPPRPGPA